MKKMNDLLTRLYIKVMANKEEGQGVVEYAGAMIVAALIVAAVLLVGQAGMTQVYNTLFTALQRFFTTNTAGL